MSQCRYAVSFCLSIDIHVQSREPRYGPVPLWSMTDGKYPLMERIMFFADETLKELRQDVRNDINEPENNQKSGRYS